MKTKTTGKSVIPKNWTKLWKWWACFCHMIFKKINCNDRKWTTKRSPKLLNKYMLSFGEERWTSYSEKNTSTCITTGMEPRNIKLNRNHIEHTCGLSNEAQLMNEPQSSRSRWATSSLWNPLAIVSEKMSYSQLDLQNLPGRAEDEVSILKPKPARKQVAAELSFHLLRLRHIAKGKQIFEHLQLSAFLLNWISQRTNAVFSWVFS